MLPEQFHCWNEVYSDKCSIRTHIFEWFVKFRDVQESLNNGERLGRPRTACIPEMIEKVRRHFATYANDGIRLLANETKVVKKLFIYPDFNKTRTNKLISVAR